MPGDDNARQCVCGEFKFDVVIDGKWGFARARKWERRGEERGQGEQRSAEGLG